MVYNSQILAHVPLPCPLKLNRALLPTGALSDFLSFQNVQIFGDIIISSSEHQHMLYCPDHGSEIDPDNIYCSNCGRKFDGGQPGGGDDEWSTDDSGDDRGSDEGDDG